MRDLVLFGLLAYFLIRIPKAPYIGALAWVLFGVMNPHRLTWGPAFSFPFAQLIALVLIATALLKKDSGEFKGGAAAAVLGLLLAWCAVTTPLALNPEAATDYLLRVTKTFVMTWVILYILRSRQHVDLLLWTLVLSVGFYGVKGGIFTLATGGQHMVNGPPGGVIEGNNSLAVGLVATIPLMYYLWTQSKRQWIRRGLLAAMALSSVSILGSYSRGAVLAVFAMGLFFWLRGRHKVAMAAAGLLFVLVAVPFMPERWADRMETVKTYEADQSAMGRIVAWETAYNIAKARFPVGGGFEWQGPTASARYSPEPTLVLVPHSIYFEMLGTQGFIGLGLYLLFWFLVWRQCAWLREAGANDARFAWARTLGSMVQVAMVGYAVGGAFLNLAFWEFCYYLYAAVAVAKYAVMQEQSGVSPGNVESRKAAKTQSATGTRSVGIPRSLS